MEVSIDDLKKRYETLDTYELLALKENGGLTETALSVLEQELSKRKPPEEESEKILESKNILENVGKKQVTRFFKYAIRLLIILVAASVTATYIPNGFVSTLYYNVFHPYQYYIEKSSALAVKGEYSQAIKELLIAREKKPNNYLSYFLLGNSYIAIEQPEKAKEYFKKVVELNPNPDSDALVCIALATAYLNLGESDKVEPLIKKAIHLYEKDKETQKAEDLRRVLIHIKEASP